MFLLFKKFPVVDLTSRSGTKRPRFSTGFSTRSVQSPSFPSNMGGGPRRIPPSFGFAFGDVDDEFYMPPHLGPSAVDAATTRAIANSRQPRSFSGMIHAANMHRSRNTRPPSQRSQPQPPSQAGTSLESAISID